MVLRLFVIVLFRLLLMVRMRMTMLFLVVLIHRVIVHQQQANSLVQNELLLSLFLLFLIYRLLDILTVLVDWFFLWDDLVLVVTTGAAMRNHRLRLLGSGSRWTLSLLVPDKPVI